MFGQLKQIKQAMDIQNSLKNEKVKSERNGVSATMNATFEIEDIKLNPNLSIAENEKLIKDCLSDANRQLQMKLMQLAPQLKSKFGL